MKYNSTSFEFQNKTKRPSNASHTFLAKDKDKKWGSKNEEEDMNKEDKRDRRNSW